jgi:hypothetical protein
MPQWVIPGQYTAFENEQQAMDFCKVWGLLPQNATKQKVYKYKGQNMDVTCEIIGFADLVYAVIQMGEQLHNIHPSYLREMQNANYGKGKPEEGDSIDSESIVDEENVEEKKETAITLQEGKVSVEATVSGFALVPNPFSKTDDEVVIFEQVSFLNENETIVLESAWSSYSIALKKLELQAGDNLTFEAKLVAKKLNKHPVKYKINNAAKITKKNPQ